MTYKTRYADKRLIKSKKTIYNDRKYDSKYEASIAMELDVRKRAGEILDFDCQYKVEMWAHCSDGVHKMKKSHKIDFRLHNLDGSYTLLEAKGFETADYKERRKWLETFWLPLHLDHDYEVVYQGKNRSYKNARK